MISTQYPEETKAFETLSKYLPENYREDLKTIREPTDFYGQNIYTGYPVKAEGDGYKRLTHPAETPRNALGWATVPQAMYWGPKFLYERYKKPVIITESGTTCSDNISPDGKIHDTARIDYLRAYLKEISRTIDDGTPVTGYMVWTLYDLFEWSLGFTARAGLVYTNHDTLQRIPKDSFYWYKKTIEEGGKNL